MSSVLDPARLARAVVAALLLLSVAVPAVLAHPLGNFTINHHAGIRVERDRVLLDVVIDQAEIPTFQAVMELDEDGDGEFSPDELWAAKTVGCTDVGTALTLQVDGAAVPLRIIEAGVTFPAGNGGLSTMRLVCTLEGPLAAPLTAPATIAFEDAFEPERIGWREVTLSASELTITGTDLPSESPTGRLTAYPDTLEAAPDVRSATFTVTPGGPRLAPLEVPDADPIPPILIGGDPAAAGTLPSDGPSPGPVTTGAANVTAALPAAEAAIPEALRSLPVTPALALLALATAALLGAGHALTPGHGKTLMAAYLVGSRGTPRHALGLGAAVSVSHTLGILGLALVVVAAQSALPPDLVVRTAPVIAAATIVVIGAWMLANEVRRWRMNRPVTRPREHPHDDDHEHGHDHEHAHAHSHDHDHPDDGLEHSHGGVRHRHAPPAGSTISWRSLFVLGLAGGLIPSTSALLILLTTIAAGQPAWGIVLVVAFGLGMAAVMAGVGLAVVYAGGALERGAARAGLARATRVVPFAASLLVVGIGIVLTTQAVAAAGLG